MQVLKQSSTSDDIRLTGLLTSLSGFDRIRKTIRILTEQTAVKQFELILIVPTGSADEVDCSLLEPFGAWQLIGMDSMTTLADGWAAGVPHARATHVVLCEDHCYPEPQWAAALIQASSQADYALVSPAVENGNPATLVSWSTFQLTFLEWFAPDAGGPVEFGPGHNSCYRKDVLESYADLKTWFVSERVLHMDLIEKGHAMWIEPAARTHHVNISRMGSYLSHSYQGGRIFGGMRSTQWPLLKKVLHAGAFPLVPLIRIKRVWEHLNTPEIRRKSRFWPALPYTMAGLVAHAVGEAMGYLTGPGNALEYYLSFEAYRSEHVRPEELALLR